MPTMPPPIELDLTDAVAVYLDRCEAEGFASSTVALYRIVLEQFVAFAGRQDCTRSSELTLELALAWQRYLRTEQVNDRGRRRGAHSRRLAPHTVHGYCRTLRTFAGWLADYTDLPANPLAKFRPGRLPKKEVQPLSEDEHRRVIESLDPRTSTGLRNLALVSMLLDTGPASLRVVQPPAGRSQPGHRRDPRAERQGRQGSRGCPGAAQSGGREALCARLPQVRGIRCRTPRAAIPELSRAAPGARRAGPHRGPNWRARGRHTALSPTGFATRLGSPTCAPAAMCSLCSASSATPRWRWSTTTCIWRPPTLWPATRSIRRWIACRTSSRSGGCRADAGSVDVPASWRRRTAQSWCEPRTDNCSK